MAKANFAAAKAAEPVKEPATIAEAIPKADVKEFK